MLLINLSVIIEQPKKTTRKDWSKHVFIKSKLFSQSHTVRKKKQRLFYYLFVISLASAARRTSHSSAQFNSLLNTPTRGDCTQPNPL